MRFSATPKKTLKMVRVKFIKTFEHEVFNKLDSDTQAKLKNRALMENGIFIQRENGECIFVEEDDDINGRFNCKITFNNHATISGCSAEGAIEFIKLNVG